MQGVHGDGAHERRHIGGAEGWSRTLPPGDPAPHRRVAPISSMCAEILFPALLMVGRLRTSNPKAAADSACLESGDGWQARANPRKAAKRPRSLSCPVQNSLDEAHSPQTLFKRARHGRNLSIMIHSIMHHGLQTLPSVVLCSVGHRSGFLIVV